MMTMATKNNIFDMHLKEYLKADKAQKGEILKHVCFVTGMHRKASIRKFRVLQMRDSCKEEKRGARTYYTADVTAALKDIWKAGNEVCGELLCPMVGEYIDILQRDKMWAHSAQATAKLRQMSQSTLKRRVGTFLKARSPRKGICSTKPSHLKHLVPIFLGPWRDKEPGFGQIDTVRHSDSAFGDAVHTLNYTDAHCLGVFPRAQFNKGALATKKSLEYIKDAMYFSLKGVHPDTGSEFINEMVIEWGQNESIELSRSRPNHKNDNMYVEERNGHVIRKTVGYIKLDCLQAVDALNDLYQVLTPYLFHFVAVRRMIEKERLASRYKRKYEKIAKTPYQRIQECDTIPSGTKEKLKTQHAQLNPLVLKHKIDARLQKLYDVQKWHGNQNSKS
jgi:hypothetical protein